VSITQPQPTFSPKPTATAVAVAQIVTDTPIAPAATMPAAETTTSVSNGGLIVGGVIAVIVLGAIGLIVINRRKQRTNA
jgi:Zn-dependent alcohol dehydrogenase